MSQGKNYIARLWLLLLVATLVLCGMFYLPGHLGNWQLKPIDLLSEIRVVSQSIEQEDSLALLLAEDLATDSTLISHQEARGYLNHLDSVEQVAKTAEYNQAYERLRSELATQRDTTTLALIEDYHPQRLGLKHFYDALARGASKGRPTRIAVLGDSFIEGDIMTDALREYLQRQWGGRGVGWMPITSETAGFRRSIKHQFGGWQDLSLLGKSKRGIPLTGHIYRPHEGAWVCYEAPLKSTSLGTTSLLYRASGIASVAVKLGQGEVVDISLPATEMGRIGSIAMDTQGAERIECRFSSRALDSLVLYGCAIESTDGVIVDNLSLRGNSGVLLLSIENSVARAFAEIRPYDLIILQYGLNVANDKQQDYSVYIRQMQRLIVRLRDLYPEADILLMGVSDRSQRSASGWGRMAGINRLHEAQRLLARSLGVTFWSALEAMERLGGMPNMVEQGWAAKDYTHMTHRGGRKIAEILLEALMLENNYYDQIQQ